MRFTAFVEIEPQEVQVNITAEDFMVALAELPEAEGKYAIIDALNAAYGVLKRVPDKAIADMDPAQRMTIFNALLTQCNRFVEKVEECPQSAI